MELFEQKPDTDYNYLPKDGTLHYLGKVLDQTAADKYLDLLLREVDWQQDQAIIFGKKNLTKRKVAWYGDYPYSYTYSKTTKYALPWTDTLLALKKIAEKHTKETYNSCLLNLYHDGSEGMAWHSDAEKDLKKDGAIGSMSFGAERKFALKHKKTGEKVELLLAHGSLLLMAGTTQTHWLHRLPPTKRIHTPRVNLTFRTIVTSSQQSY